MVSCVAPPLVWARLTALREDGSTLMAISIRMPRRELKGTAGVEGTKEASVRRFDVYDMGVRYG